MKYGILGASIFSLLNISSLIGATAIPGDLDLAFGSAGKLVTVTGAGSSTAKSIIVQPDGKLVVVGTSHGNGPDFTLIRYLENGSLDGSFGVSGKVVADLAGSTNEDVANCAVMQSDGKFVVGGYSGGKFALARFNVDGTLDTTFSGDGKVAVSDVFTDTGAKAVKLQSDGRIIIAGTRIAVNGNKDFGVMRFSSTGVIDTGFGANGMMFTDFATGEDVPSKMAVASDDKIVVVGYTDPPGAPGYQAAIVRYTSSGALDSSFSGDGRATLEVGTAGTFAEDVAVRTDGKIIICGSAGPTPAATSSDFLLARYGSDGNLDSTFGTGGSVTTDLSGSSSTGSITEEYAHALSIQIDGKIVLAGRSGDIGSADQTNFNFALVRYLENGAVDMTFGLNGYSTKPIGTDDNYLHALALQPDGKIIVAGSAVNGSFEHFAVARLWGFSPSQTWRLRYFSSIDWTGNATDSADPDLDGLSNLLEYALGTSPMSGVNSAGNFSMSLERVGQQDYPTATITKPNGEEDLAYSMDVSGNLSGWNASTAVITDNSTTIKIRDNTPVTTGAPRFSKIQVRRLQTNGARTSDPMTVVDLRKICNTAEGYIELGLLEDAYNLLENLPTRAKISREVIILHMSILVKSGNPLKASYLGENLCFGDPNNVDLMVEVGQLKHDAGEHTEALKWLQSVEPTCRNSAGFHHLRALCHVALGDLEACALALREAHRIDPDLKMQSLEDPAFEALYGRSHSA